MAKRLYRTGEMIDRIKVGQRAKAFKLTGDTKDPEFLYEIERKSDFHTPFHNVSTNFEFLLNANALKHVWELQPIYVTLREALLALGQGKHVKNGDAIYYIGKDGQMVMEGKEIGGTIHNMRLYETGWEILE